MMQFSFFKIFLSLFLLSTTFFLQAQNLSDSEQEEVDSKAQNIIDFLKVQKKISPPIVEFGRFKHILESQIPELGKNQDIIEVFSEVDLAYPSNTRCTNTLKLHRKGLTVHCSKCAYHHCGTHLSSGCLSYEGASDNIQKIIQTLTDKLDDEGLKEDTRKRYEDKIAKLVKLSKASKVFYEFICLISDFKNSRTLLKGQLKENHRLVKIK